MKEKENNSLKEKVFSGFVWGFGERILAQLVSFIVSVVLARMLLPSEYGIIAMVLVFINIANVFAIGGFGEALVQKKEPTEADYNTIFYYTLTVSAIVYILLFFIAPFIARFYKTEQMVWVLRVLALKIVISSVSTVQHAYVQKHMMFKKFFFSTLGGTLISGIVGIVFAYMGFGVWALVAQYLSNSLIDMCVLFFTVPWRPKLIFSMESARSLMPLGWRFLGTDLVNAVYNELRSLVIGKKYTSADLAFYNRGDKIPSLAISNIDSTIGSVVFPAMTTAKSPEEMKRIGRRSIMTTSYLIFPLMIGMMITAPSIVRVLYTDKWSEMVVYMQILCIYWMTQPIQTTNWQILKAMGRGDLCLKLEILKKLIGTALIIGSMMIGVKAVAVSAALHGIIGMIINIVPNKKLIGYSLKEQMRDIFPAAMAAAVMGAAVYSLSLIISNTIILLLLQICTGILVYLGLSVMFKMEAYCYLLSLLREKLANRK